MQRVRFLMIGGFLGAGKTTTLAALARHYRDQGLRVGLVTNDQAFGLVDTMSLRAQGFDVGEVTGACFCCKFNDLVATAEQLAADERPDIILAEPVGSCTDLMATVMEPLSQLYGENYEIGPLAVLCKPEHGAKILGGAADVGFSDKAAYIFLKQLEEAQVIVLNKVDKLSDAERERILALLRERFPGKQVIAASAQQGAGLDELRAALARSAPPIDRSMEVDYDVYAEGEAELGWLNATVRLAGRPFNLDRLLLDYVEGLRRAGIKAGAEPAHLKVLASADGATAIANVVSSGGAAELSFASGATVNAAELTVNARVAIDPERLSDQVRDTAAALATPHGLSVEVLELQSFRPGRPQPTHRFQHG